MSRVYAIATTEAGHTDWKQKIVEPFDSRDVETEAVVTYFLTIDLSTSLVTGSHGEARMENN